MIQSWAMIAAPHEMVQGVKICVRYSKALIAEQSTEARIHKTATFRDDFGRGQDASAQSFVSIVSRA